MSASDPAVLGLIAGEGGLPLAVARSARRRGRSVKAVAFHRLASDQLEDEVSELTWLHPGEVGAAIEALRSGGAREAVLAGKVPKASLFEDPAALRLDARASELIGGLADRRDDSILELVAGVLRAEGIRLLPQTDWVGDLLAGEGVLGGVQPDSTQLADVAFAWPVAKSLGAFDIGQTVVVRDRAVLAVEAVEGTDAAIRRGGAVGPGASVVKVAKPNQDPRFDVPTIGPDTLSALVDVGAGLLAVEAGQTLLLDRPKLMARADAAGIVVLGVSAARVPAGAS